LKTTYAVTFSALVLLGCAPDKPPAEALRMVRTVELRYDKAREANRYFGTVQARHEVDQGFRVGGKIASRKVDVGQSVREGEVLAVLDAVDYRLAEEAASQQLVASKAQARQAESDRKRLEALKADGSVSAADEEQAQTRAQQTKAAAEADESKLELARNRLKYTVLRAPRSGVVTVVRAEVGQVVAEGQPVVSIAAQGEPEIVVDVPEDHFASFKKSQYKAWLATAPGETFELSLRELSLQAAQQTRSYRARLKPVAPRPLPLGATATVLVERIAAEAPMATIPASAITQANGEPAVWIVRRGDNGAAGTVELTPVVVHGYRNDEVLVSGPPAGVLVVTAGVQKMAPGLHVALGGATRGETAAKVAAR
jgi:membrane fusion protein, multidrug efflux system